MASVLCIIGLVCTVALLSVGFALLVLVVGKFPVRKVLQSALGRPPASTAPDEITWAYDKLIANPNAGRRRYAATRLATLAIRLRFPPRHKRDTLRVLEEAEDRESDDRTRLALAEARKSVVGSLEN